MTLKIYSNAVKPVTRSACRLQFLRFGTFILKGDFMKTINFLIGALPLLISIGAIAQQNPPPVRLRPAPTIERPSINVSPANGDIIGAGLGNLGLREILIQNIEGLAPRSVLIGRDQILPVRAILGLNQGTFVRKVIIVAMTQAGHGRLEVLVNGQPTLIKADGIESYDKQVGVSLETIEAEINGEFGRNIQTIQLRTNGNFTIAMLGATVINQVTRPHPQPIPQPLPPPPPPLPQPHPRPIPHRVVCSQDAPHIFQSTFTKIKNFAYSGSGLNLTSNGATDYAVNWTDSNPCDLADGFMRRIANLKQFAYSGSGLNMTSSAATQFALENENRVCVDDTSYADEFQVHYQFAYSGSGLNLTSNGARDYAFKKIQPKYFTCLNRR